MIIPIRTNRRSKRRPLTTELLIIANLVVYLGMLISEFAGGPNRGDVIQLGMLASDQIGLQLVTYQFLHDPSDPLHVAFNMLFLWVFGGAVEGRLGRLGFAGFYLIGGIVAGVAHLSLHADSSVIGASGSVSAVTGAFIALFPRSLIRVLVFFFFIGLYDLPATWVIGFFVVADFLRSVFSSGDQVAYAAHLAGYVYGFALAFSLLALRILPREEFDVFFLFTQARRRSEFRRTSRRQVGGLLDHASADTSRQLERQARKRDPLEEEAAQAVAERRAAIARQLENDQYAAAADAYVALLHDAPSTVMSRLHQLDIAAELARQERYSDAVRAYELILEKYRGISETTEVRLLLATFYTRRLKRFDDARRMLDAIGTGAYGDAQTALVEALRAEVGEREA